MIFRQFRNEPISAFSYMVGCSASGLAAVIDPNLPAERYILAAADHSMRIIAVLETHMHADYYSTGRVLARHTRAALYIPAAAGARFEHQPLCDGDRVQVGTITLRALHTPGHTPEHTAYVVADGSRSHQPWFVLSGDCLFVGDVGRADLLDLPDTGPDILYSSLFDKLLRLPDYVEIFPGHYGGSACGGAQMSGKGSSTIGFERRFNWALQAPDRQTFVERVSATPRGTVEEIVQHRNTNRGELPLPEYCNGPMKLENQEGIAVPGLYPHDANFAIDRGAVLIDVRSQLDFATNHPSGALNITYNRASFMERLAALLPEGVPIICFSDQPVIAHAAAKLAAQSQRNPVQGYTLCNLDHWKAAELPINSLPSVTIDDLHRETGSDHTLIIDVRNASEWARGVIPGARLISFNQLRAQLETLPRNVRIITICESGARATAAASMLLCNGFPNVATVTNTGMSAYARQYPTVVPVF